MDQIGLILVLVYVTRVYLVYTRVFKVVLLVLLGFCEGGVLTPSQLLPAYIVRFSISGGMKGSSRARSIRLEARSSSLYRLSSQCPPLFQLLHQSIHPFSKVKGKNQSPHKKEGLRHKPRPRVFERSTKSDGYQAAKVNLLGALQEDAKYVFGTEVFEL